MRHIQRLLVCLTACSLVNLVTPRAHADQFDLCVPFNTGVPGVPGPPDWWTPNSRENVQWTGSAAHYFDMGAEAPASFRVAWNKPNRMLSFDVQLANDNEWAPDLDHFVLAFDPTAALNDEVFLVVSPLQVCTSASDPTCTAANGKPVTSSHIQWATRIPTGWSTLTTTAPPNFSVDHATVYTQITSPTTFKWRLKMRVQIPVAAGGEADPDARMYANALMQMDDGSPTGIVAQHYWPRECQPPSPLCQPQMTSVGPADSLPAGLPTKDQWGRLKTNQTCDFGVSIDYNRVGSNVGSVAGAPGSTINPDSETLFRAEIKNGMSDSLELEEVQATFRIANWGLTPVDPRLWETIGLTKLTNGLASGAYSVVPPASPTQGILQVGWTPAPADVPHYQANRHQCIQVELAVPSTPPPGASGTWGDIAFARDSVYRNMDFAMLSTLERTAQVNVWGVHEITKAPAEQKILLVVYTSKMPTPQECREAKKQRKRPEGCDNGRGKKFTYRPDLAPKDPARPIKPKEEGQFDRSELPLLVVHGYHQVGNDKVNLLGRPQVPIYEHFSSFGYYLMHEGPLEGFEYAIDGAEKVGDNMYALKVGKNHAASLGTRIRAIGPDTPSCADKPDAPGCQPLALDKPRPVDIGGEGPKPDPEPKPEPRPKPLPKPEPPKGCMKCGVTDTSGLESLLGLGMLFAFRRRRRT